MHRLAPSLIALVVVVFTADARAQNAPVRPTTAARPDPCLGATCSGHGQCMREVEEGFCFCDEGYAAEGLTCRAVPRVEDPRNTLPSTIGLAVVQLAAAEDGHDLAHVGLSRTTPPGPLIRYVRPDALWCSDFVSWVYRAAGLPFTGGYHGGWMLPNNAAIRAWFERRGAWVSRGNPPPGTSGFGSFQPRAGDYVRISTTTWNHSAIVRYVEGSTLFLVEGNAGGHVRLTRYTRWRNDARLEGFGLATLVELRMEALRRAGG
ncbi:MAG: hypothetical protein J0L92_40855 [Deltaproteobacteria bacterium]|nr:hypothetical protein [Deltaproteobacteria bacterium]